MPVKIKGMEMPQCCNKCKIAQIGRDYDFCGIDGKLLDKGPHRPKDCPLEECE